MKANFPLTLSERVEPKSTIGRYRPKLGGYSSFGPTRDT